MGIDVFLTRKRGVSPAGMRKSMKEEKEKVSRSNRDLRMLPKNLSKKNVLIETSLASWVEGGGRRKLVTGKEKSRHASGRGRW